MFKNAAFFISLSILMSLTLNAVNQSGFPLIHHDDAIDLAKVKQQLAEIKHETVLFDVDQDQLSDKKFQRKGILVRRENAIGTILICHGYLGCKRDAIGLKHLFPLYNVMVFDFRAHGELTDGQLSTIGRDEALDVMGAAKFIKSDPAMQNKPVMVFGYSMGAVASIEAQSQDETLFDAMILDCPFDSTDNSMRRGLDEQMKISVFGKEMNLPGKELYLKNMYNESGIAQFITSILFKQITNLDSKQVETKFVRVSPIDSIKKVTVPCLFIHCENDKKVPVAAVEGLYENKPGFKQLWITPGKKHFGSYNDHPEKYWYRVNKFLQTIATDKIDQVAQERIYDDRTTNFENKNEQ